MRTNVTFRHPAEFIGDQEDGGGVLAATGAQWFAVLLRRIPGLALGEDIFQEDWGVLFFVQRNQMRFWIGLSSWDEGAWVAHVHHGSFAWLQRLSSSGTNELKLLLTDVHEVLANEPAVSQITWHDDREMTVVRNQPA